MAILTTVPVKVRYELYIEAYKYELTDEIMELSGHTLHRIRALRDIPRIGVRKGDLGGWIEGEINLSQEDDCWVSDNAAVFEFGHVADCALVYENAQVYGNAVIHVNAEVSGNARVFGYANIHDNAWICGNAEIHGEAEVSGNVCLTIGHYNAGIINE